jgi:hypothetical protein
MTPVLLIVYSVYLVLVGVQGNAPCLFTQVEQEEQFIYWILVVLIVMALYDLNTGLSKSFAVLIVLGFLLKDNKWQQIATNAKAVLQGL